VLQRQGTDSTRICLAVNKLFLKIVMTLSSPLGKGRSQIARFAGEEIAVSSEHEAKL
jgi:hypothetical protein